MNLAERLRSVVRPAGSAGPGGAPSDADRVAGALGGEWHAWRGCGYLTVERRYPPGYRHGRVEVADGAAGFSGSWPALAVVAPDIAGDHPGALRAGGRLVFVDLETTGLSGGAGTYAFLVGCGWFEPPSPAASADQASPAGAASGGFRVRQFLLTSYAAERGLLEALGETLAGAGALATYNGKTFDLPIIDTRFVLHRMASPFEGIPHLDLLHPARRLWSASATIDRSPTARLSAVEAAVLGYVREDDVPGFEIPWRYFQYVRSGDPRPLEAVLEHNRRDLLSLAILTARVAHLLERGAEAAGTAGEALGLGRLYQRRGMLPEARVCFARAAGLARADEALLLAEALRACAILCRRERRHAEAAEAWRQVLAVEGCPPHLAREAREALAVHCEHRLRDFRAARQLAIQSLELSATFARTQAIRHRVARLDRKLSAPSPSLL